MTQQSKSVIPLPGNDGLNEERLATEQAFRVADARRGFYEGNEYEAGEVPAPPPHNLLS